MSQTERSADSVVTSFESDNQAAPLCFVLMWFDDERRPVYDFAIKPAAEVCGYRCVRTDDLPGAFSITHQIVEHIFEADIIVADLTGARPNVFYELGISHVIGHKTILVCDRHTLDDFLSTCVTIG